jgi:hypothetical protein
MTSKSSFDNKPVGGVGAGNFGSAVANLLASNRDVILYARDEQVITSIKACLYDVIWISSWSGFMPNDFRLEIFGI